LILSHFKLSRDQSEVPVKFSEAEYIRSCSCWWRAAVVSSSLLRGLRGQGFGVWRIEQTDNSWMGAEDPKRLFRMLYDILFWLKLSIKAAYIGGCWCRELLRVFFSPNWGIRNLEGISQNRKRTYIVEGEWRIWRDGFIHETLCVDRSEVLVHILEAAYIGSYSCWRQRRSYTKQTRNGRKWTDF
jgi:hypothetical protein